MGCPDDTDVSSKSNVSVSGANTSDITKGITEHCTSNGTSASIITSTPVRTTMSKSSQVFNQSHSSDSIVQLDGPNDPHDNKKDSKLSKQQNKASKISNSNKYQFEFKKSNSESYTESKPASTSANSSKVINSKKSYIKSSTESTPVSRSTHSNKVSNSKNSTGKSSTKSTPVIRSAQINQFFTKVSNLPPIAPLPKDVQVVVWKIPKISKSKSKKTL